MHGTLTAYPPTIPYTQVPNCVFEGLMRITVPGEALRVLSVILRKTYGFHQKAARIGLEIFEEMTGLDRGRVGRALKRLLGMNIVTKQVLYGPGGSLYSVNEDYATWKGIHSHKRATCETPQNLNSVTGDTVSSTTPLAVSPATPFGMSPTTPIKETSKKDKYTPAPVDAGAISAFPSQAPHKPRRKPQAKREKSINALNPEELKSMMPTEFFVFWEAYPRKASRVDAMKAWLKLSPGERLIGGIMDFLEDAKKSREWTKDDGQYVPHPSTFLNQRRWTDELSTTK